MCLFPVQFMPKVQKLNTESYNNINQYIFRFGVYTNLHLLKQILFHIICLLIWRGIRNTCVVVMSSYIWIIQGIYPFENKIFTNGFMSEKKINLSAISANKCRMSNVGQSSKTVKIKFFFCQLYKCNNPKNISSFSIFLIFYLYEKFFF